MRLFKYMKEWIVSVVAVVFIVSISSYIVPEGKIGSYIKGIFAFLLIFVIIKPIFSINNNDFNLQSLTASSANIEVQTDYLDYVYYKKYQNLATDCIKSLRQIGVENASIDIKYFIDGNKVFVLEKIIINLQNAVMNTNKEHIDIIEEIRTAVSTLLKIDKKLVIIYE